MNKEQLHGVLFKLLSCFCAACMIGVVRHLSDVFSVYQLTFFRCAVALLFFLPWVLKSWPQAFQTSSWPLQISRTFMSLVAMTLYFMAIQYVPIATATAISFITPIFTAMFAILWLSEPSDARKWEGMALGLIGALIVIRPGAEGFNAYALLVIISTLCWAGVTVAIKVLAAKDKAGTISFLMMVLTVPMSAPLAIATWRPPAWEHVPWVVALGFFAACAQYFFVRAYALADVTSLTPVGFSRLVFAGGIAYLAFGEMPDLWTIAGSAVIISSVLYTTYHVVKK